MAAPFDRPATQAVPSRLRMRVGLVTTLIGLFIFTIGAKPSWFGLARSSGVGFIKISVFLFGLAVICLGGYIGLLALWKGMEHSILADIGVRLVGTGYIISVFSGMADVFGFGSQPLPQTPFFGPLQASGVLLGQVVIAIGFLMSIPYHSHSTVDEKSKLSDKL